MKFDWNRYVCGVRYTSYCVFICTFVERVLKFSHTYWAQGKRVKKLYIFTGLEESISIALMRISFDKLLVFTSSYVARNSCFLGVAKKIHNSFGCVTVSTIIL